jgi:hypothetical protein
MLNLMPSFEPTLELQFILLGCGLATFCSLVLQGASPLCTWIEWADGNAGTDDATSPEE